MKRKWVLYGTIIMLVAMCTGFAFGGDRKVKVGGRIMVDYMFPDSSKKLESTLGEPIVEGAEFRRARLFAAGMLYERIKFKAQYDFAGGDADFKDLYLELVKIPILGGLRIGHFHEQFSLSELTSSKYITFMERALPVEAFAPSRNLGFMVHNSVFDGRATWAGGIYKDAGSFGDAKENNTWNITIRLTGTPWFADDGKKLFHLGGAYSYRNPNNQSVRFRAHPESHLSPRLVDTGTITGVDSVNQFGGEMALVFGPLSLQGEYILADVDRNSGMNPSFDGYYVYASYFLTGEPRPYKKGIFHRVKPKRDFLSDHGIGAIEVAGRYTSLDLSDKGISGGEIDDISIGLNWYLHPHARVMVNYVNADLDGVDEGSFYMARFQIDF